MAIGFLVAFIWSIRSGQFEDEYTPSVRILFDDEIIEPAQDEKSKEKVKDSEGKDLPENNQPKT